MQKEAVDDFDEVTEEATEEFATYTSMDLSAFKEDQEDQFTLSLKNIQWAFVKAFLDTWAFDGYEKTKGQINTAHGNQAYAPTPGSTLPWGLVFVALLGLPSRPSHIDKTDTPQLSPEQFGWNWIGGWVPMQKSTEILVDYDDGDKSTINEKWIWSFKKKWQFVALFSAKLHLIPALKVLTWPFKLIINFVKSATEFLPNIGSQLLVIFINAPLKYINKNVVKNQGLGIFSRGLGVLLTILLILTALIPLAIVALSLVTTAITSPLKSARDFSYFVPKWLGLEKNYSKVIVGGLFMLLSLSVTAVFWAILLPILISAALPAIVWLTQIPFIATFVAWVTHLPFVLATIAWVSHLPFIATSLGFISSGLTMLSTALVATLGPLLTALSGAMGLTMPISVVVLGTTVGAIAAPIATGLNLMTDELSYSWTSWQSSEFPHNDYISTKMTSDSFDSDPFDHGAPLLDDDVVAKYQQGLGAANTSSRQLAKAAIRAETADNPLVTLRQQPAVVGSNKFSLPHETGPSHK